MLFVLTGVSHVGVSSCWAHICVYMPPFNHTCCVTSLCAHVTLQSHVLCHLSVSDCRLSHSQCHGGGQTESSNGPGLSVLPSFTVCSMHAYTVFHWDPLPGSSTYNHVHITRIYVLVRISTVAVLIPICCNRCICSPTTYLCYLEFPSGYSLLGFVLLHSGESPRLAILAIQPSLWNFHFTEYSHPWMGLDWFWTKLRKFSHCTVIVVSPYLWFLVV